MKTKKKAKKVVKAKKPAVKIKIPKKVSRSQAKHCRNPSNKSKDSKVEKLKQLAAQRAARGETPKKKKGLFGWFKK
jgi:hypothetical protein